METSTVAVDSGKQNIEGVLQTCVEFVDAYLGATEQSGEAFRCVVVKINQRLSEFVANLKPQSIGKRLKLDRSGTDVPSHQIDATNLCLDSIIATQDALRMFIQTNSKGKNSERHTAFVVVQAIKWDILTQFVESVRLCNENHRKCLRLISDVNQASFMDGRKTMNKRQKPKSRQGSSKGAVDPAVKVEDMKMEYIVEGAPEVFVDVDMDVTTPAPSPKQDDTRVNVKKRARNLEALLSLQTAKVGQVSVSYNFLFRKMIQLCSRKSIRRQYTTSLNRATTSPVGFAQACFISDKLAAMVRQTLTAYDQRTGTTNNIEAWMDGCFHSRPSIMKFLHLYGRENGLFDEEHRGSLRTNATLKDLFGIDDEYVRVNRLQKYIRNHCARNKDTMDTCSATGAIMDAVEKWALVLSDTDVNLCRDKTMKRKRSGSISTTTAVAAVDF
jgi:hypothetical protein